MPSVLSQILASFREKALSERDKGTDFEHLSLVYLRNEPYYRDLYRDWRIPACGKHPAELR